MADLPFLKNKNKNQGGGGPAIERIAASTHPDREGSMDSELLDQVADEFFQAIETKNKQLLREALSALVLHIQDADQAQDEGEMS